MCSPPEANTASWRCCHSALSCAIWVSFCASLSDASCLTASMSVSGLPPSTISVPRPAILVAMVITPGRPACAITCASRSCCLAFNTWCSSLSAFNKCEINSEFSIEVVPTKTGWPRCWQSLMSKITAAYFSFVVR